MTTITSSTPRGEVLRSTAAAATMFSHRSFGLDARIGIGEPAVLRRHPHIVRFAEVEADLDLLIDRAIAAIADGEPDARPSVLCRMRHPARQCSASHRSR